MKTSTREVKDKRRNVFNKIHNRRLRTQNYDLFIQEQRGVN